MRVQRNSENMLRLIAPSFVALICLATSTTAFSFPPQLLHRASGCSNAADIPCNQGLPSNFCCGSTNVCLALAGNTTAICCPDGQSCSQIQTVSCDIQLQNATAHPENALKTTDLTGTLPLCGSQCCPFGYSCSGGTTCVEESNQNLAPGQTAAASSSSKSAASTAPASTAGSVNPTTSTSAATTTQTTVPAAAATASTVTTPVANCPAFPAGAVLAGFFPGIVAGILISVACFCLLGSRRRREAKRAGVSVPIFDSASAVRTDFLRKQPHTPSSSNPPTPKLGRSPTLKRMAGFVRKSMHMNSNNSGPYTNTDPMNAVPRRAPLPPMTSAPPQTPMPQTPRAQRANSGVSISVFAASDISTPTMVATEPLNISKQPLSRESDQTTISEFIGKNYAERPDLAGLKKGEPFIQQPAHGNYTHGRKGSSGRNLAPKRREDV